jgi:hypothetical protein
MTTGDRQSDTDVEVRTDEAPPLPPDPESLAGRFADPAVRNYLFTGLAALAMVFVVLFQRGTDLGGLLLITLGAAGMVLRWPGAPLFFLLVLFWFLIFPFGIPDAYHNPSEIIEGRFRPEDLVIVASVVIYMMCHYRLYGLTAQALPFENRFPRKDDKPSRRPVALIAPGEMARMLYLAGAVVLAGQLVWIFATHTQVLVRGGISFRFAAPEPTSARPAGDLSAETTRFILLTGLLFFGTVLARLVFGYWRLRQMSPAEGRMILNDASWDETRRERARVENWRAWGREKQRDEQAAGPKPGPGATP